MRAYSRPKSKKPMVLMARLAQIWTNQEGYRLFVRLSSQLNSRPAAAKPAVSSENKAKLNQEAIMATDRKSVV